MSQKELMIIQNLLNNPEYTERVISHLNEDFFTSEYKTLFKIITEYTSQYDKIPKISFLRRVISESVTNEDSIFEFEKILNSCREYEEENIDALIEETEKYCYHTGLEKAIVDSYSALESKDYVKLNTLYESLKDKFSFSFNNHLGHCYFEDFESQYSYYTDPVNRLSFGIPVFDEITDGGLDSKRLVIFNCGTHVGKTLMKCSLAASHVKSGKKVVFFTLEDSKEGIVHRIDANMNETPMDCFNKMSHEEYISKISNIRKRYSGELIIQEMPLGSNANNFYNFIKDLKLKKNFYPDVIYIDYLGICGSYRIKTAESEYISLKKVSEELRGLSQTLNVPVITSAQNNRSNQDNSDAGMDALADSFAIPRTADILWSLWASPEMKENNQILMKQLKNRLRPVSYKEKIILGCDYSKMKIYDENKNAVIENRSKNSNEKLLLDKLDKVSDKISKPAKKDFTKFDYE